MNGLRRYNEIQKALSSYKESKGWKLRAGNFQKIASKVYHSSKGQPLKQVINNFDVIIENVPGADTPQIPPELFEWSYYFDFDINNRSGTGKFTPDIMPQNILVKSPQLFGDEIPIDASLLSYEDHFFDFSAYCDKNRPHFADRYGPMWRFTEPKWDWNEQKWLTVLEINDLYGYEPGIGGVDDEDYIKEHEAEIEEKPEIKPEAPPEKLPEKEDIEIRKIHAQTERAKAEAEKIRESRGKISELNKAIDRLESQLERGLITKKEYKKYLNKLYSM